VVFTALALAGLWSFRRRVETWIVGASFLVCWGVFLGFYAGSYDYGADVRYSLMSYAPLAVLSGAGLARAATWSGSSVPRPRAAAAIAAALLFHWLLYLPLVRAVGEEAWGARADVAFVERILPDLPANAVVLTQTPSTFFVRGVNAVQTSIAALDPNRMAELFERFGGGVGLGPVPAGPPRSPQRCCSPGSCISRSCAPWARRRGAHARTSHSSNEYARTCPPPPSG
jgi:hypothetical protein